MPPVIKGVNIYWGGVQPAKTKPPVIKGVDIYWGESSTREDKADPTKQAISSLSMSAHEDKADPTNKLFQVCPGVPGPIHQQNYLKHVHECPRKKYADPTDKPSQV